MGMVIGSGNGYPFGMPHPQKEQKASAMFPKKIETTKMPGSKNPRIAALQRQKNRLLAYKQELEDQNGNDEPSKQEVADALKWVRELIAMIDRQIAAERSAELRRTEEAAAAARAEKKRAEEA